MRNIQVTGMDLTDVDKLTMIQAITDGEVSYGKYNKFAERALAKYEEQDYAFLVNSGSSANLLAFMAFTSPLMHNKWRIHPGDEIITVATAFPTTITPIILAGCVPVFIDINEWYNIDVEMLEAAYSPKTKGVFIAHTLGIPYDIDAVQEFCHKHNLFLISDCCDALGSLYKDVKVTNRRYADVVTNSFYPAHHITAGEGGAVLTSDSLIAKIIQSLRDWGRSCFIEGTLIDTDKGLTPIESIKEGDSVLTHTGNFMPVLQIFKTPHNSLLQVIKCQKKNAITCTPTHKFYTLRKGEEAPEWICAKDIHIGDFLTEKVLCDSTSKATIEWKYNAYKHTNTESLPITPDLMRLCGYWLAEGSVSKCNKFSNGIKDKFKIRGKIYYKYKVEFAFNTNELAYIDDVISLMHTYFGITNIHKNVRKGTNGVSLEFNTRKGYEFFLQLFSKISYNKRLPSYFLSLDASCLVELLKGFWYGDGSYWKGDIKQNTPALRRAVYSFCTTSSILHEQIRKILLRVGINPAIGIRTPEQHHSSVVNDLKIIARRNLYMTSLYGKNARRLAELFGESANNLADKATVLFTKDNEYALFPVTDISEINDNSCFVYNLHVEKDNSYHANGVVVHNCQCDPGTDNKCGRRFDGQYGDLPEGYDHKYVYSHLGFNLKMTSPQAALLYSQLKRIDEYTDRRIRNFDTLHEELHPWAFPYKLYDGTWTDYEAYPDSGTIPSWFGYPILLPKHVDRKKLMVKLNSQGVATRLLFSGNILRQPAWQPEYAYRIVSNLDMSNYITEHMFWIGCWHGLTEEDVLYEREAVKQAIMDAL